MARDRPPRSVKGSKLLPGNCIPTGILLSGEANSGPNSRASGIFNLPSGR